MFSKKKIEFVNEVVRKFREDTSSFLIFWIDFEREIPSGEESMTELVF